MTQFLLFTLYAPLASWGEIAVGESRGSWDRPSRSAVLGLVAAGLGLLRKDQGEHDAMDRAYGVAVRLDATGTPLIDYHTAQTVAASVVKKRRPATRAELLGAVPASEYETILSRRTYRQDALATVVMWQQGEPYRSLIQLAEALKRPRFVLYAGRKANAFGLPLAPEVVDADTLAEALARREPAPPAFLAAALRPSTGWGREVSHDPCRGFETGLESFRRETRRDTGAHRGRWQFSNRVVEVGLMPMSETTILNSGGRA